MKIYSYTCIISMGLCSLTLNAMEEWEHNTDLETRTKQVEFCVKILKSFSEKPPMYENCPMEEEEAIKDSQEDIKLLDAIKSNQFNEAISFCHNPSKLFEKIKMDVDTITQRINKAQSDLFKLKNIKDNLKKIIKLDEAKEIFARKKPLEGRYGSVIMYVFLECVRSESVPSSVAHALSNASSTWWDIVLELEKTKKYREALKCTIKGLEILKEVREKNLKQVFSVLQLHTNKN